MARRLGQMDALAAEDFEGWLTDGSGSAARCVQDGGARNKRETLSYLRKASGRSD